MKNRFREVWNDEEGTEVIQTVLLIPFFVITIFMLLYLSLMPYSRAQMNYIAAQAADMSAVYGGNQGVYAPTNVLDAGGVDAFLRADAATKKSAKAAFAQDDWKLKCVTDGTGAQTAQNVGDPITCEVRYVFKPPVNPSVFPGGSVFLKTSVIQKTSFAEVGELS